MGHSHARQPKAVQPPRPTINLTVAATAVGLLAAIVWSYWPTLDPLLRDWQHDDNYSVGQLVPFAALYMLWTDRRALAACRIRPCWWGIVVILLALAGRAFGLLFLFESAERYSLVLAVVGVVLLVAGWEVFRKTFWILLFLFLMVPLPGRIHNLISGPLQSQATGGAVFLLELLGVAVAREGTVMTLNGTTPVAVAEACSGLRMLTAFVVVGCVLAYVIKRPGWQKVVIVLSTVPVALLCNLIRLTITAELFLVASSETAQRYFHDFAGLTMMPMALAMMLLELWIMSLLFVPDNPAKHPSSAR